MTVTGDKIKVALLQKMVFDAAQDQGRVSLADFRHHDADSETALGAQRARKKIWTVIELARGCKDAFLGFLRDGVCDRRAIDDQRDGSGRKSKIIRQLFLAHGRAPDVASRALF